MVEFSFSFPDSMIIAELAPSPARIFSHSRIQKVNRAFIVIYLFRTTGGASPRAMRQTGGMPRSVQVATAGDPRLADYTRLTDVRLRTHLEAEHGLFIAEGSKVIGR